MKATRFRISNDVSGRLKYLQTRTCLTPNILLRVGFGLSLRDKASIEPDQFPEDGKELNRNTITGDYDVAFIALLKEWLVRNKKSIDNIMMEKYFRAHLNRGAMLLSGRIRSLTDLALLD